MRKSVYIEPGEAQDKKKARQLATERAGPEWKVSSCQPNRSRGGWIYVFKEKIEPPKKPRTADWFDELPERERHHLTRLWESNAGIEFCIDKWLKENPGQELELSACIRSGTTNPLIICPYQRGREPCRW